MPQSTVLRASTRPARAVWTTPVLLVVLLLTLAGPAAADPPAPRPVTSVAAGAGPIKPGYSRLVNFSAVLQPALAVGDAPRAVFVQLAAVAAAQQWSSSLARGATPASAAAAVRAQRQVVLALARRTVAAAPTATVLFTVTDVVPGIGLLATPSALRVLAGRPGVVAISALVPKVPAPAVAAASTGDSPALPAGLTGAGVRIGIIDTGIDYTHADFGGAGTTAAAAAARRADSSGWQPTGAVAGGYDFVGDDYDAAPITAGGGTAAHRPVPRPDPNPLDCNGHGTRVAGAIGGSGVTDGRPFGGSDPRPSPGASAIDISPGAAPGAELFAFKVFGCSGATDAVIPALDRAVDPDQNGDLSDRLDVVDLSLTSTAAAADDPETGVLDALALLGVLPVVAAGGFADDRSSLAGSVRALSVSSTPVALPSSVPTIAAGGRRSDPPQALPPDLSDQPAPAGSVDLPQRPDADVAVAAFPAGAPLAGSGSGSSASAPPDPTAVVTAVAALVHQQHPAWTPEQIKAALIDTAGSRQPGSATGGSPTSAPDAGADGLPDGAVDAGAAAAAGVLAYSSTVPGAVSVAFGTVAADVRQPQVVATAAVVVQNTGETTAQLFLDYLASLDQPGVSFQVSPESMVLPAGGSALATLTMTITPAMLGRAPAEGTSPQQRNPLTGLDEPRQYTAATSGNVVLRSAGTRLQVPVSAEVRPESSTAAADGTLAGAPAVVLSGTGFALSPAGDPGSAGQQSLLSVLELGYRSPELPSCRSLPAAATAATCSAGAPGPDLAAVGVGRTPSAVGDAGAMWFGVATYRDMTGIGRTVLPTIDIDVDGDNTADYTLQVQAVAGTDLLYALLFDDRPAVATLTAIYPVNFNLGDVDTNATDSDVLLIPVDPTALGYRPGQASYPIRYSVSLYAAAGAAENGVAADGTPALAYDVAAPAFTTAEPLWRDQGGTAVPYRLAPGTSGADALVLHLHGADAQRSQILRLTG